ncbi:MAG: PEP-utilizing enzyme, partial [Planctomycetota bacterium]
FLDVVGEQALEQAVRRTMASFASQRALAVAGRDGGASPEPRMSVLVQRMVRGKPAGVLFTKDPMGENEGMIAEVTHGAGEAVTDGTITPLRILLKDRAGKATVLGGCGRLPERSVLRALRELGERLERTFDGPQDVEWVAAEGTVFLLQARPITALEIPKRPHGAGDFWTSANSQEAVEDPISPLTYTFLRPLIDEGRSDVFGALRVGEVEGEYMRVHKGRIYFNADYFRRFLEEVPGIPKELFDQLIFGQASRGLNFPIPRPSLQLLGVARHVVTMWFTGKRRFGLYIKRLEQGLAQDDQTTLVGLSVPETFRHLRRLTRLLAEGFRLHVLGTALAGGTYLLLAKHLQIARADVPENAVDELLAMVSGVETAEASEGLFKLAAGVRDEPLAKDILTSQPIEHATKVLFASVPGEPPHQAEALRPVREAFQRFLERFGHLAEKEAELARPRWREEPAAVLRIVKSYVEHEGSLVTSTASRAECMPRKRRLIAKIESALKEADLPLLPWRLLGFRYLLTCAEKFAPYRENMRFQALRAYERVRRVLLALGSRLHEAGAVQAPGDVFFLEFDELTRAFASAPEGLGPVEIEAREQLSTAAAQRKVEHERAFALDPPKFLYDDGSAAPAPLHLHGAGAGRAYLEGVGVSTGVVTGPVRLVRSLDDALNLEPGTILLARAATPAWTPAFFLAKGVILDIGGMLSHCAVIAREYGIPCVIGARGATALLSDGDHVTLDAHTGRIYMHGPAEPETA